MICASVIVNFKNMNSNIFKFALLCAMFMNFTNGHLELDWEPKNPPFDSQFYEDLLNPELCQKQLLYILANDPSLLTQCKSTNVYFFETFLHHSHFLQKIYIKTFITV